MPLKQARFPRPTMKAAREGRRKECFAMPRKNRSTALILVLALLACLAGQAAMAAPAAPSQATAEAAAGNVLNTVLSWLTAKWPGLGRLLAASAGQLPRQWEKSGSSQDPNGGSSNVRIGSQLGQP